MKVWSNVQKSIMYNKGIFFERKNIILLRYVAVSEMKKAHIKKKGKISKLFKPSLNSISAPEIKSTKSNVEKKI